MLKTDSFHVIGIAKRTSNVEGQASVDIPALWQKFMAENVVAKIPNKLSEEVFCVYTEYDSDHNKPYTTLIGCKVANLNDVPEGFKGITIEGGEMKKFTAKGDLMQGVIWQEWAKIWDLDLDRTYQSDYEVYSAKAQNPQDAEVDIFVGIN